MQLSVQRETRVITTSERERERVLLAFELGRQEPLATDGRGFKTGDRDEICGDCFGFRCLKIIFLGQEDVNCLVTI